jgi:Mor family transcriptional regulator
MLKINQKQAQEIIDKFVQGHSISKISDDYRICVSTIFFILHGKTWKNCKRPDNIQDIINSRRNKINQKQAQEIIDKFTKGTSVSALSEEYGLSTGGVGCILRGDTWKECKRPDNIKTNDKITQEQAQNIIDRYVDGESSYALADEYNLWQTSVCNIVRGETWPQCKRPDNIIQIINSKHPGQKYKKLPQLNQLQQDVLIGSLLGDGSINKPYSVQGRGNAKFSKTQKLDRKPYLDWHSEIMGEYSSGVVPVYSSEKLVKGENGIIERHHAQKHLSAYRFDTFSHPNITKLRKEWYPNDIKQIPTNLVLNPQRIAIWYFDDGSNNEKQRYAVLCTNSFTVAEVEFLAAKLKDFNLFPKITFQESKINHQKMPMLKFSKSSYDNLIHMIKPYMLWNCFNHKIKWHHARKQWECSKITTEQVKEIITLKKTISAREISKQFNVHVNTIYSIVSGRSRSEN